MPIQAPSDDASNVTRRFRLDDVKRIVGVLGIIHEFDEDWSRKELLGNSDYVIFQYLEIRRCRAAPTTGVSARLQRGDSLFD